ncbi:major head protein [Arthrobacter phage Adumb2043]|uniref:Major capsid protein n=1 Tax=Arthrobacter phage Adumb2043 TaxID=2776851 RepID=A0A7M1CLC1_9CAUD|nr:major head protein [Arthrobacter phage Adumb2043]QOP65067.1 major capsid protein [Arthrobacter phage Adumb2043]
MANTFYTAEQVAKVAVAMATQDSYLGALVNRNFENDLLGGGGKGRTVNVRVPSALIARSRGIDDVTTNIVLDSLTETTVPVTLGEHIYNAVGLSEGDLSLNLEDFSKQVLSVQVDAVVDAVEEDVAAALRAVTLDTSIAWDEANPVPTFTKIRQELRKRGVPQTGLNVVVGTNVYAALLDAKAITDVSESGSTAALRDGNVGQIRGFQIVESTRVDDDEIIAFHRDAFTLAVRAPIVPAGASFGQSVSSGGYSLRYLRDYDVTKTMDRSMVSTFAGVAAMPLYKVERDYTAKTATVTEVPGGAAFRMSIGDTEPA